MFSGIKNGHPWSKAGGGVCVTYDNTLITDLSEDQMQEVLEWIKSSIIPRKTPMDGATSYGLKHYMEKENGIHISNNQFKDAMLMCGFQPVDESELNWVYCISKKSPCFVRFREKHGYCCV